MLLDFEHLKRRSQTYQQLPGVWYDSLQCQCLAKRLRRLSLLQR